MKIQPSRQPTLFDLENPSEPPSERPFFLPGTDIFLGTSSFTATGWQGSFYPPGMRSRDFLPYYSSQFQTVEIDSTFYGTPAASTVTSWNEKTPPDFIFAVMVARYTHVRPDFMQSELEKVPDFIPKRAEFDPFDPRAAVAA